jgi:hypothetical protein
MADWNHHPEAVDRMRNGNCSLTTNDFAMRSIVSSAFRRKVAAAGLGILMSMAPLQAAEALDNWEQMAPEQFESLFSGIGFGNGTFVAVGADGMVGTSPDGFTWTTRSHGTDLQYRAVIFAQDKFVAGGNKAPVIESVDGASWTPDPSGKKYDIYGLAYSGGTFVAVGLVGGIWTSPDGRTWTVRESGTFSRLHGVAFGNGLFVATGLSGTILTSPTGESWTPRQSKTGDAILSIAFANGKFVATTHKGAILTSTDGLGWNPPQAVGGGAPFNAVTWGDGIFVAVGYGYVNPNGANCWTSPDGLVWTRRNSNTIESLTGVSFGNGRFIAVGESGAIVRSGALGQPEQGVVLQNPKRNGDAIQFFFNSQPDRTYEVQSSPDLITWSKVRTVTAFAATTSFSELTHGAARRSYRVLKLAE